MIVKHDLHQDMVRIVIIIILLLKWLLLLDDVQSIDNYQFSTDSSSDDKDSSNDTESQSTFKHG